MPMQTMHGCDSILALNLTVVPEIEFKLSTVNEQVGGDGRIIIDDLPDNYSHYTLNGIDNASLDNLTAGVYEVTVFVNDGTIECSATRSIEILAECLSISVKDSEYVACADNPQIIVPYTIERGAVAKYNVNFDPEAIEKAGFRSVSDIPVSSGNEFIIPMPSAMSAGYVRPGRYTAYINFPSQICDTVLSIPFSILYPSSILSQRWEDVLFVQNADYNGGYDFAAYQWYKGGEAIEGATASYLHVPEGLDTSAEYSVALTRSDDGVTVPTCPVTPRVVDGVTLTLQQNVVPEGGEVRLTSDLAGTATLYDVSGQLVSRHALEAGDNVLPAPGSAGYYLLRVVLDNGRAETYHLQVVNN